MGEPRPFLPVSAAAHEREVGIAAAPLTEFSESQESAFSETANQKKVNLLRSIAVEVLRSLSLLCFR